MISQLALNLAIIGSSLLVVGATVAEEYVDSVGGQVAVVAPQAGSRPGPSVSALPPVPAATASTYPQAQPREGAAARASIGSPRPRASTARPRTAARPRFTTPPPPPPVFPSAWPSPAPPLAPLATSAPSPAPPPVPMATSGPSPATAAPSPESDCATRTPHDLTVVTLNTHRSYGANGLERIASEISALEPDVVLLQEIDRFYPRTGGVDQAGWFAQRLGMHSAFGANVTRGRSQYGTAVLSRAPIVEQANTLLPNGPGGEQRGLLRVAIDLGHATINVYNAHLQHRMAGLREAQARAVASVLASDPRPRIIGGDFNAGAGTRTLGALSAHVVDSWPESGSGPGGTVRGGSRIDYLMASRDLRPVQSSVHRGSVSDHAAVRTRYDVAALGSC